MQRRPKVEEQVAQEEVNAIFEVLARKHVLDPDQLPLWEAGLQDERVLL